AVRATGPCSQLTGDSILGAMEAIGLLSASHGDETTLEVDGVKQALNEALEELREKQRDPGEAYPRTSTPAPAPPLQQPAAAADRPVRQILDPVAIAPILQELRRLHGERQVVLNRLRESQRMLRALLMEIDQKEAPERLAERITKTLGYGAEIERSMRSLRGDWSSNEFASERALDELEEAVRKVSVVRTERLLNQ